MCCEFVVHSLLLLTCVLVPEVESLCCVVVVVVAVNCVACWCLNKFGNFSKGEEKEEEIVSVCAVFGVGTKREKDERVKQTSVNKFLGYFAGFLSSMSNLYAFSSLMPICNN